jgi:ABC-type antimicrobial peptide transport system permease subunit
MDEMFYHHLKTKSPGRAKFIYWKYVISLAFSYTIKKRKCDAQHGYYASSEFSFDMIRNYVKVALRNLYQYSYFSFLNAFGLAVGMAVSLLLISLITYVQTYDDFHENHDRIYTIISERIDGVEQNSWAIAPVVLAEKLRLHADVEDVVRIHSGFREQVRNPQGLIPLRGYYVEPNFLEVFTYEVIKGNPRVALSKPKTVILTENTALKLFNTTEVVGNTIELEHGELLEVGAVMKNHPINSHLKFEILVSFATLPAPQTAMADQWMYFDFQYLYVLLAENADTNAFQNYLNDVSTRTYANLPVKVTFEAQHLGDIAMGPDLRQAIGPKWEASGMIVFIVIAALILLPACFNYTNISIARALKRAKEIGLRKTMGGVKSQIFLQFIIETVVISLIAFAGALLLFILIRDEFQNSLVSSDALDLSMTPKMIILFTLFAIFTGLVAGVFPALYFGKLNPIQALKNKAHTGSSGMKVRKVLTIFQFALSFGFILSLVVFNRQYQYSLNFDFGFAKENIVNVELQGIKSELVKAEFSKLASVKNTALSSELMGLSYSGTWVKNAGNDSTDVSQMFVDQNYLSLFDLKLLAGKNFPDEVWQREKYIIVNEEFLKHYKIQSATEAIGRTYLVDGNELEIIGVVKNFHYASLRFPINKFLFRMNPAHYLYAQLKVTTSDAFTLFTSLEQAWKNLEPDQKLKARFFEEELNDGYHNYIILLKIVGFLGMMAITISILGLLGMVVYTAENKVKEISIRKVMGASVFSLNLLLSKDYLKLMLWAIIVSVPVTAYLFHLALPQIQYYSVSLSVWDVLLSAAILLGLGIATITSQTYKTALTNPAETLKAE